MLPVREFLAAQPTIQQAARAFGAFSKENRRQPHSPTERLNKLCSLKRTGRNEGKINPSTKQISDGDSSGKAVIVPLGANTSSPKN